MWRRSRVMAAALLLVLTACAAPAGSAGTEPARRAATVRTTGCGLAPERTGSGVAVGNGIVVTVAHLVVRADSVTVSVAEGDLVDTEVVAVDLERDLAALRGPLDATPAVALSDVEAGAEGLIVDGSTSGSVPFTVIEKVSVSIEDVLGSDRHNRIGYKLAAATSTGDSGAGAYDADGRLIGIVFASSDDGTVTWLTGSVEIQDFLTGVGAEQGPLECDPALSHLHLP